MTLSIERARSRRPVTWLTVLGVLLLPVLIGAVLVAALNQPTEQLDNMRAAIVNDDEPVTIEGQMVPLGRQLAAGLVAGPEEGGNLSWTISNDDDAATGIAEGTYDAVITIPPGFSAAATSTAPGGTPTQATIEVTTSPNSRIVDEVILGQVAQTAATVLGRQLSTTYLENVFVGFTTLGDQLGVAADGGTALADGAQTAADGAVSLADGVAQLSSGAGALADGAGALSGGAAGLSSGAAELSGGMDAWAGGARETADGLDTWAGGAGSLAGGQREIAAALGQIAGQVPSDLGIPPGMIDAVGRLAENGESVAAALTTAVDDLTAAAADCDVAATPDLCAALTAAADRAAAALPGALGIVDQAGTVAAGLGQLEQLPQLGAGLGELAAASDAVADGLDGLAGGARDAAAGSRQLSDGAAALAGGAGQLAQGASELAAGAGELGSGAAQLSGGASAAADGAAELSDGVGQLADGTGDLAEGLGTAASAVPSYTDDEAGALAEVVAAPVAAEGVGDSLFGAAAIPLLTALTLWIGSVASFIAMQAVPRHALSSRRASVSLAARALAPAAAIGAAQGVLVSMVVQIIAGYDLGTWLAVAGLAVLAGVAFAAVNQALVAVFGGAGRWIAAVVGVLALATGIVSTVPGWLSGLAGFLPTTPAYRALLSIVTEAGGAGGAITALVVWGALAFVATVVAVTARRTTSTRTLLRPAPALG